MNHRLAGGAKANVRRAAETPSTLHGDEHIGVESHVNSLLLGRELHHAPRLIRVAERGEDLPAHAEIGVAHVTLLFRARQAACDPSKILSGNHWLAPKAESPDRIALRGAR